LHPSGGCSFARHGSYARLKPQGVRIARWYCPEGHRTFSLLPDFLAVKLPGLLAAIEDTVVAAFSAKSMEAAADALRGLDVTLPSALRWLHRRVRAVQAVVDAVSRSVPEGSIDALARGWMAGTDLGRGHVLVGLRRSLSLRLLSRLPAPVGFQSSGCGESSVGSHQQDMGPDGAPTAHYDEDALRPAERFVAVRHILVRHAKAAGLDAPYLGSHVLRHSNAARQLDLGTHPRVLSDLLGHRDPESISAYVRIATQSLRDVSLPLPT
jgi:hypothetical protein